VQAEAPTSAHTVHHTMHRTPQHDALEERGHVVHRGRGVAQRQRVLLLAQRLCCLLQLVQQQRDALVVRDHLQRYSVR
jgi:hypothetical protein